MSNEIKVRNGHEAVRFLSYFITRVCDDKFDEMFDEIEFRPKERAYKQEMNETTFMWGVHGGKPKPIIIVRTDDSGNDLRILVDPVFYYDKTMWKDRDPILFNIRYDTEKGKFVVECYGGKWGPLLDKCSFDPFHDFHDGYRAEDLLDLFNKLKMAVSTFNFNLNIVKNEEDKSE